ncbi:hypothetical protein KUTeg_017473 [Tegillarca granosa]|uniref:Uncharacterized protein n=1 Tax=Tegillarca granosa TaxID=220873 RepID=A0ABQ9EFC6_TEGGR|nr:hypothetical protein KUTeg_017473 [Tegillarca granosa]
MVCLYASSHCHRHIAVLKRRQSDDQRTPSQLQILDLETDTRDWNDDNNEEDAFFNDFDKEVFESLHSSSNLPMELIKICLPAVLSLALCPLTLYLYQPFTEFIWPKNEYAVPPDINDAIACFLAPAGLVYATSFGFAFQQALTKQHRILEKITSEISMIDQIATFCTKLNLNRPWIRKEIYKAIKAEAMFLILQILDREPNSYRNKPKEDIKVKIWSVVDMLRDVNTDTRRTVDRVLCEKILSHIMKLNSICSDRMGVLHTRIHPVKWAFLETLGFFSFIGVLLLKANSYRMELVMCIITVFSISMLCYVVSDLDSPFSGFFRVDLSVLRDVICRLENMYKEECQEVKAVVNPSCVTMETVSQSSPRYRQTKSDNDSEIKQWNSQDKVQSIFIPNHNGFNP